MKPEQQHPQHKWLHKLIGEWTFEMEGPNVTGTETFRSLGGLWVIGEGHGTMPDGQPADSIITIGYDPERNRYPGTWVGSMMTHLWIYDGVLDESGNVLSLHSEGPDMSGKGGTAKYKDVIEWKDDDYRVFTGNLLKENGEWECFMTSHYRRKK